MNTEAMRKKRSYGGCTVDHFSPTAGDNWPKAINIVLSLEEALKLQLALQSRLLAINGLAVNLCLYPQAGRITVNANKLRSKQNADT